MERRKSEPVGAILLRYLRQEGLESPLASYRLVQAWPHVVGKVVAERTREVSIRGQMLLVRLSSPALRAELQMRRRELVARLNAEVGVQVIADITFL